jgi:nucleoside-diphosphate-sugar epimerase
MAAPRTDSRRTVLLTGATGVVGPFLLQRLPAKGHEVHAISRRPAGEQRPGVTWERADLGAVGPALGPEGIRTWIHAAPLWLAPPLVPGLARRGLRRVLAFGSTSRFTKARSPSAPERDTAARLERAEAALAEACAASGVAWTVFRPTLVWGGGRDRNVSAIAAVARRLGFVPVAGAARGARQPVHADDLARACLAALDNATTFGRAYDLPGGETLAFDEMVARIARGMAREPRTLHVPVPALRLAIGLARLFPGLNHLSPQMANRMNEDLVFDDGPARRDFGYAPLGFVFPEVYSK